MLVTFQTQAYSEVFQVYLVTGGQDYEFITHYYLSSTEILTHGDSKWTDVGPLPFALFGLKGVSLNNNIIMTGNFLLQNSFLSQALKESHECLMLTLLTS